MSGPGPDRYTQTATGQNTACTTSSTIGCGVSAIAMKESGKKKSAAVTRKPPPSEIKSHFFIKRTKEFKPLLPVYLADSQCPVTRLTGTYKNPSGTLFCYVDSFLTQKIEVCVTAGARINYGG